VSDDVSKSCKDNSSNDDEVEERTDKLDNDLHSDQVPTLAIHENSSLKTSSGRLSMNKVAAACAPLHGSTHMHDQDQALSNSDIESPDARGKNIDRRDGGKTNSTHVENGSFGFATRSQDNGLQKVINICCFLGYDVVFICSLMLAPPPSLPLSSKAKTVYCAHCVDSSQ